MKFITKNSSHCTLHVGDREEYREETINTKFLGLQIDNHLNSKNHTEQLIPKLSRPCYAIGSMVSSVTLTFPNQFTMHTFSLL